MRHSKISRPTAASDQTEKDSSRAFQVCFGPDSCRAGCEVSKTGLGQLQTQAPQRKVLYSITSSAMASTPGGMVRLSTLAILRLITNSNLVDCTTGRSEGFSPLRIRPT